MRHRIVPVACGQTEDMPVRATKNPTPEQLLRRHRRSRASDTNLRTKSDPYWQLRLEGHPPAYAKRAFRDQPPMIVEHTVSQSNEYMAGVNPEDILFPVGSTFTIVEIAMRPPLTEDAVANAKPRHAEYTIWQEGLPGFGLRVRPSGIKSFILLYRLRGENKLRKLTLGRAGFLTLEGAKRMARECCYEARMGRDPVRRSAKLTVSKDDENYEE